MKRTSRPSLALSLFVLAWLLLSCNSQSSVSAAPAPASQNHEAAKQGNWQTYTNVRFAYSLCYPADVLTPQGEAENGDGQKFLSRDSRAQALVYGSNNVLDQSVSETYSDELQADEKAGIKVTYRVVKPGYFVVSGSGAGKIIYQKTVLVGDVFKTLRLEYPEDQKAVFDPIVSTMSDCFQTNLKTQRPEDTKTTKLNNLRWWS